LAALDESPPPMRAPRSPLEPSSIDFAIGEQTDRADIPDLCERARVLLEGAAADRLVCDLGAIHEPDVVTVEALARLQLTSRRLGRQVRLEHASPELRDLLAFTGLSEALPLNTRSRHRPSRQSEEREQRGGVEEERDSADPTV
jgi:ABC-type transporter Mla MlaB component